MVRHFFIRGFTFSHSFPSQGFCNFRKLFLSIFYLAVISLLSHRQTTAQQFPQIRAADWWSRAKPFSSKYFEGKTDLNPAEAKELISHMDQVFANYIAFFKPLLGKAPKPKTKAKLFLFQTKNDYHQTLARRFNTHQPGSWGLYIPRHYALVGWREDSTVPEMKKLLQHEGLHQAVDLMFGDMPTWANEGLAEVFERGLLQEDDLILGEFPDRDKKRLLQGMQEGVIMPFDHFLSMNQRTWNARLGSGNLNYLQAWSICHFFIYAENKKYEKNFLRFLNLLNRDMRWENAFAQSFGTPSVEAIEKKWAEHIRNIEQTDYQETFRRIVFLNEGLKKLGAQDIFPTNMDELQKELQKIRFSHSSQMFGELKVLRASDRSAFRIPYANSENGRKFVLVDRSLRKLQSDANISAKNLPSVVTVGLEPRMFVGSWRKKKGKNRLVIKSVAPKPLKKPSSTSDELRKESSAASKDHPKTQADASTLIRTWTSRNGVSKIKARLLTFADGIVSLETTEGKTIKVSKEKLSNEDQDFLKRWKKSQAAKPQAKEASVDPPSAAE